MRFIILLSAFALVINVNGDDACKDVKCPSPPKHYEEFGCTPVTETGKCCPTHFDCSSLQNRDKTKCHYGNESVEVGKSFHNEDIESSCTIGCYCRGEEEDQKGGAQFTCTHIDCPEFFGHDPVEQGKKCIRQYDHGSCCSKGSVCGEDLEKLAKCEFGGKTYYEGQRIDTGRSCYSCYCGKGFENKPVEENKHCRKVNCNMELHYYARVVEGCIPVYYKTDDCCPIDWRCPDKNTTVIADLARKTEGDSTEKCTFGSLKMNVGDFLSPAENANQCTVCTCRVPPMAHCIQTCN